MRTIYIYPHAHYFDLQIRENGVYTYSTTVSGFSSLEAATTAAQILKHQIETGEVAVEDLRQRFPVLGKQVIEWARHFGVSRNALYKAARNKKISMEEEILRRLPLHERQLLREEFGGG